jgi:hypothetical protein
LNPFFVVVGGGVFLGGAVVVVGCDGVGAGGDVQGSVVVGGVVSFSLLLMLF